MGSSSTKLKSSSLCQPQAGKGEAQAPSLCARSSMGRAAAFGAAGWGFKSLRARSQASPEFVWAVRRAASGGTMCGPGETWAGVAELADAQDLGSCGATRGGSSPPLRIYSIGLALQAALLFLQSPAQSAVRRED